MKKMVNKYWENEEAIVTSTESAELRLFTEAGKFQIYPKYASEQGGPKDCLGKGCVWDIREMDHLEAIDLIAGVADAFFAVLPGDEMLGKCVCDIFQVKKAMHDAVDNPDQETLISENNYEAMTTKDLREACKVRGIAFNGNRPSTVLRKVLIALLKANDKQANNFLVTSKEESPAEQEVVVGYDSMTLVQLRLECKNRGIHVTRRTSADKMVSLLVQYDLEHIEDDSMADTVSENDSGDEVSENELEVILDEEFEDEEDADDDAQEDSVGDEFAFNGKYLTMDCNTLVIGCAVDRKKRKVYKDTMEFIESANEWFDELTGFVAECKNKSGKNKGKVNIMKLTKKAGDWIDSFDDLSADVTNMLDTMVSEWIRSLDGKAMVDIENAGVSAKMKYGYVEAMDKYLAE